MRVSIVTISYNQAQFLERALKSVIEQDHDDIEYIIVDPGSTDGSRDIIERYRSRIAKLIFEPDKGPADGLNKGFAHATGEIYGYLNSDDMLLPGVLSRVNHFFQTNPNVDVVSGHCIVTDEHDRKVRNSYSDRFSLLNYAYGAAILMQPSTFFRAEIFERTNGFNISNKSNWDGELFVDMLLQGGRFAVVGEFWSAYRLHWESITSSKKLDDQIREHGKVMFRKIMGRDMLSYDLFFKIFCRLLKWAQNPRGLYERLSKGPIYGRSTKNNCGRKKHNEF